MIEKIAQAEDACSIKIPSRFCMKKIPQKKESLELPDNLDGLLEDIGMAETSKSKQSKEQKCSEKEKAKNDEPILRLIACSPWGFSESRDGRYTCSVPYDEILDNGCEDALDDLLGDQSEPPWFELDDLYNLTDGLSVIVDYDEAQKKLRCDVMFSDTDPMISVFNEGCEMCRSDKLALLVVFNDYRRKKGMSELPESCLE